MSQIMLLKDRFVLDNIAEALRIIARATRTTQPRNWNELAGNIDSGRAYTRALIKYDELADDTRLTTSQASRARDYLANPDRVDLEQALGKTILKLNGVFRSSDALAAQARVQLAYLQDPREPFERTLDVLPVARSTLGEYFKDFLYQRTGR